MSQEARMRTVIDEAVAAAVAPLEERVEALEARLRAPEDRSGPTPAPEQKRAPAARTAKAKAAQSGEPSASSK